MRYQIYEAKSVKHDAQQRVGMIAEARKALKYKAFADFDAIKIAF